jgi:transcriptional regulator with XRE-family HTH domain
MEMEKIKKKIEKSGLKKKYIADKLGISNVELSYYLNNRRKMPEPIKAKLRGFFNFK